MRTKFRPIEQAEVKNEAVMAVVAVVVVMVVVTNAILMTAASAHAASPANPRPVCDVVFAPGGSVVIELAKMHASVHRLASSNQTKIIAETLYTDLRRKHDEADRLGIDLSRLKDVVLFEQDLATDKAREKQNRENRTKIAEEELNPWIAVKELIGHTGWILSVAYSPDGSKIATGATDNNAIIWDLGGRKITTLSGHTSAVTSVVFSPDGSKIATTSHGASGDGRMWTLNGHHLGSLAGYDGAVTSVAFSPDGSKIAFALPDGTAAIRDFNGNELTRLIGYPHGVSGVWFTAFSPDGSKLLVESAGNTVTIWDLTNRTNFAANKVAQLTGHEKRVILAAFSPDGTKIVTGSADHTARIWDLNGNELVKLVGHSDDVVSVAFSPNGANIVTGSDDHTARIWDLNGNHLATLAGHNSRVKSVAFSPDGISIVTGSGDHTARIWSRKTKDLDSAKKF